MKRLFRIIRLWINIQRIDQIFEKAQKGGNLIGRDEYLERISKLNKSLPKSDKTLRNLYAKTASIYQSRVKYQVIDYSKAYKLFVDNIHLGVVPSRKAEAYLNRFVTVVTNELLS